MGKYIAVFTGCPETQELQELRPYQRDPRDKRKIKPWLEVQILSGTTSTKRPLSQLSLFWSKSCFMVTNHDQHPTVSIL